jgi:hypothetical protein
LGIYLIKDLFKPRYKYFKLFLNDLKVFFVGITLPLPRFFTAETKTRITDCADTEKKNQRIRMKKIKVDKSRNTEKKICGNGIVKKKKKKKRRKKTSQKQKFLIKKTLLL